MRRGWLCGWLALLAGVPAAAAEEEYDPARDPTVNPPSLSEPAPADPARIARDERLVRRLRADPPTLNPVLMSSLHELWLKEFLFDEPMVYNENWQLVLNPAMAESYAESEDHLSAVLTLKPGLKWHDGAPLTADDVAFSWKVITDDRVPAVRVRAIAEPIAECTAVDATTVRYRFEEPLPTNRGSIRFPVIPRHVYERGRSDDPTLNSSDAHTHANRHPVGNGPYRFVSWKSGERIVLERWTEYPHRQPCFSRVTFRVVPDNNVALLLFRSGELDELMLTPQQFSRLATDESFNRVGVKGWKPRAAVYCLGWNMDGSNPFFADRRVRCAMGCALNLPAVIDSVYRHLSPPCRGIFPPQSWAHNPDIEPIRYDVKRAGTLLDEAGWRIDPKTGWRAGTVRQPDGREVQTRFAFTFCYAQESKTSPQVAAILQQDLRRLGVEMKLRALEYTTLRERVFNHDFQAVFWAWSATPEPDDARSLLHSDARTGGRNFVGYSNPHVDALFDQARRTFDEGERARCYREISQIVHDDAPYTFMINDPALWAFHRRLRGVRFSPLGPFGFHPGARAWWVPGGAALRQPGRGR